MKKEINIVTFTGAELYNLLPTYIQNMYQANVIEQHGDKHFRKLLIKNDWPNMINFLRGGFLFALASPSPEFWVNYSKNYYQQFEDAAIAEII